MSDIYKFAAQNNLRFQSGRGELTVEQLFLLPLKSVGGFDLDTVARQVNAELKEIGVESFVEDTAADPRKRRLENSLEIVKDVIKTKQAENQAQVARLHRAVERRKILDAIGAKKDEKMSQSSLEDLEKQLAALDVE